jgi:hypothetical protein
VDVPGSQLARLRDQLVCAVAVAAADRLDGALQDQVEADQLLNRAVVDEVGNVTANLVLADDRAPAQLAGT